MKKKIILITILLLLVFIAIRIATTFKIVINDGKNAKIIIAKVEELNNCDSVEDCTKGVEKYPLCNLFVNKHNVETIDNLIKEYNPPSCLCACVDYPVDCINNRCVIPGEYNQDIEMDKRRKELKEKENSN